MHHQDKRPLGAFSCCCRGFHDQIDALYLVSLALLGRRDEVMHRLCGPKPLPTQPNWRGYAVRLDVGVESTNADSHQRRKFSCC